MLTLQVHCVEAKDMLYDEPVCNYRYTVYVNRDVIATGTVRHRRDNGWAVLVAQIAKEHMAAGFTGARTRDLGQDPWPEIARQELARLANGTTTCGAIGRNGGACVIGVTNLGEPHRHKFVKVKPARRKR